MGKERIFTTVPSVAIGDTRLTALDLRVLMVVSIHDGMSIPKGTGAGCFASYAKLAKLVRTDITNFSKAVSKLAKSGYLTREPQQMDRRRFTLRVLFDQADSWRVDQPDVGEPTNDQPGIVGEAANEIAKVVGEANEQAAENYQQSDPYYIPQRGELDFDKSKELDSPKVRASHFATRATHEVSSDNVVEFPGSQHEPDYVGQGAVDGLIKYAAALKQAQRDSDPAPDGMRLLRYLPKVASRLPLAASLARMERVLKQGIRDRVFIGGQEADVWRDYLYDLAASTDIDMNQAEVGRANRLAEMFGEYPFIDEEVAERTAQRSQECGN